jgi:hypothetical protein
MVVCVRRVVKLSDTHNFAITEKFPARNFSRCFMLLYRGIHWVVIACGQAYRRIASGRSFKHLTVVDQPSSKSSSGNGGVCVGRVVKLSDTHNFAIPEKVPARNFGHHEAYIQYKLPCRCKQVWFLTVGR